jgi:predicted DNA-binding antitoxin AbrB/MazE fold protein
MKIIVHAVFENGVFRPLQPVEGLQEQGTVLLTINPDLPTLREAKSASAKTGETKGIMLDEPGVTTELLQEVENSIQTALSNVREPEVMRQAAERMDRAREEMYLKTGLLDAVVPILREIRDGE